jgi:hypothetical protein
MLKISTRSIVWGDRTAEIRGCSYGTPAVGGYSNRLIRSPSQLSAPILGADVLLHWVPEGPALIDSWDSRRGYLVRAWTLFGALVSLK